MEKKISILRPKARIKGGTRLPHYKNTAEMESVTLPTPDEVIIPMLQHIGTPCKPTVKKGDTVYVGTLIGDSDAPLSAPIHSSVSGTVLNIKTITMPSGEEVKAVVISSDGKMTPDPELKPIKVTSATELVGAARNCGLVGLGGAGFPTHIKLLPKDGAELHTLIVNAAECEPFITSDYRECMENTANILKGIYLIKKLLGIKNVIIGVEDNKQKAINKLYEMLSELSDNDESIKLMKLRSRYPQGAEKMLIYSATKQKLPLGKLPADIGLLVMNVTTISVLYRYIKTGMPLVSKRITVDGNAVKEPKNLIVPIGAPIKALLEQCGAKEYQKVIMGGPMMGVSVYDDTLPILKQNNAVLAFSGKAAESKPTTDCIHCGRCMRICPMKLKPAKVESSIKAPSVEALTGLNVMHCIECGCCSFICPAGRPLTLSMRAAKNEVRKAGE